MKLDLTLSTVEQEKFRNAYRDIKKQLQKETNLPPLTIEFLLLIYHKFVCANGKGSTMMTRNQLVDFYQIHFNLPDFDLVDEVLYYIDPTSKGTISAEAFVKLIDINGSDLQGKMPFCFGVYAYDGMGYITKERLRKLCRNMIHADKLEDAHELLNEYVDFLLRKFDDDHDGRISFADYSKAVQRNPCLLEFLGRLIPDMAALGAVLSGD